MLISEANVKDYLHNVLNKIICIDDGSKNNLHSNFVELEGITDELSLYVDLVSDILLVELLISVKDIVDFYLLNRYVVLKDRKLKRVTVKKVKEINIVIDNFSLSNEGVDVDYLVSRVRNALVRVSEGVNIKDYGSIVKEYEYLRGSLLCMGNIVNSIDSVDAIIHFVDTFINSKYLYLGVVQHRNSLKRIAESLLKGIS